MKKLIIPCLATAAFVSLTACTTVKETREPSTHSTTTMTESSTTHSPVSATSTTETRNVRSY